MISGGNNPLSTLSGENRWVNEGKIENYAAFAQIGFKFTDTLKLSVGARYTQDKKEGDVSGLVVATGDRFNPNDPRANVTIEALCRTPAGAVVSPTPAVCAAPNQWIYSAGTGFATSYSEEWNKTTPQATLEWTASDDLFLYVTVAQGFKGGGFDDTPANIAQATTPYDPEEATNYELGFKADLLDSTHAPECGRLHDGLQGPAGHSDQRGVPLQHHGQRRQCRDQRRRGGVRIRRHGTAALSLAGSYVDAKYEDFLESAINPSTGQRLDSSGNRLQRTPETQVTGGVDFTLPLGGWGTR